jgi:hypothetical protein
MNGGTVLGEFVGERRPLDKVDEVDGKGLGVRVNGTPVELDKRVLNQGLTLEGSGEIDSYSQLLPPLSRAHPGRRPRGP